MKLVKTVLKSTSPYSQSRHYSKDQVPLLAGELHDAYERRNWRHRLHTDANQIVEIPPMAFANAIKESAKRLGLKVKGKGNKTFTKSFEAGVMVTEPLNLGVHRDDVPYDELFVPADGMPGSGKRVIKLFPRIDSWQGPVNFYVLDDLITEDVFMQVLANAGLLVGVGRFRPQNRGYYGRFDVVSMEWLDNV